jgi:hypothetical protein
MRRWGIVAVLAVGAVVAAIALTRDKAEPEPAGRALLVVSEQHDNDGPSYVEGAWSFLTLSRPDGRTFLERTYKNTRIHLRASFPAGRYRLASYVRSCAGNCGGLDPPSDSCAREITLPARVVISTVVGRHCQISLR